jgi:hypothetical protein
MHEWAHGKKVMGHAPLCMNRGFDTGERDRIKTNPGLLLNRGILASRWAALKRTSSPFAAASRFIAVEGKIYQHLFGGPHRVSEKAMSQTGC